MPADMGALASALTAETAVTRDLVGGLDEAGWRTPTPAAGWDIADQIGHLAYFDQAAVCSAVRPEEFQARLAAAQAVGGIDPDAIAASFRDLSGAQMLAWFDAARAELLGTFAGLDPRARLPWFGPAMSAATRCLAPRRVRTDRARRISPMTASSAPVRIHLRIRLARTCRANLGAPYLPAGPPDELHTTRFCRCDRTLMHLAALCIPHGTPVRSHRPGPGRR
jgi:hypothetical protein